LHELIKASTVEKLLSSSSTGQQFLVERRYSLPFQRINGADTGAKMGNPKGDPVFAPVGAASYGLNYGKEYTPDG
jgi:hypothetical protein